MQSLIEMLSGNSDALGPSLATGIATLLVLGLRALFSLARRLAGRTPSAVDDKIVEEAQAAFKDKSKDP